ncbi:MAG: hypothetical protein CMQ40_10295 [Gammaproteobacteria bacterium]|nr:hypothetical protein [Gammaproteobacteria bacterium]
MRDCDSIFDQLYKLIPRRYELTALKLGTECDEILGAFLRGQLWVMFIVGCIYSFGLYMLGIDQAILIGMVSGVASIIPYLGFVLGFVGAAIAALIQFNELYYIVYIAVIFLIAQGVESMILTPWLVGDKIGLHPLAVIFSLMLGGFLFGLVGVLLALPFAAVAMVIIRHFHLIYVDSEIYLQREGAED